MERDTNCWPFWVVAMVVLGGCTLGIPGNTHMAQRQIDSMLKASEQTDIQEARFSESIAVLEHSGPMERNATEPKKSGFIVPRNSRTYWYHAASRDAHRPL